MDLKGFITPGIGKSLVSNCGDRPGIGESFEIEGHLLDG